MIYIFRKEMKKWHAVLWVVFASLAISGFSLFFIRGGRVDEIKVATVNGEVITFKVYKRILTDAQQRINAMKEYARMLGIPESIFLKNYYDSSNLEEIAVETAIKETLLNQIKSPFNIQIGNAFFKEELIKMMPQGILDEEGRISMDSYTGYLNRLSTTPAEFEQEKEEEFKRQLVERFVENSFYVPRYWAQNLFQTNQAKKSFSVLVFPKDRFVEEAKKSPVEESTLKALFETNKEQFRIPERRKANYWLLYADNYAADTEVEEDAIKHFYEKNKSSFRIAPQVKVRHILVKEGSSDDALKTAQKIHEEAQQNPTLFARLAEKHSEDDATAKNGGLTDFFKKGTFDSAFEKAAFRLQENGEISDIVKTAQGYEIIQLEERIKASEKSLDDVRADIVKSLKGKKALAKLKSDLEVLMQNAKADEGALITFAQGNNLEQHATEWLTKQMTEGSSVDDKKEFKNQLAAQLFSARKRQSRFGYFFVDGKYVIYQLTATEQSYIQSFDDVREQVLATHQKSKAREMMESKVSEARATVFSKTKTLVEVAQDLGLKLIQTEMISVGDKVNDLSESGNLTTEMFTLSENSQLFHFRQEKNHYLVQLNEAEPVDSAAFAAEESKIIKNEKLKNGSAHVSSFIASLQRNAKIEVDKNVLKAYKGN